MVNFHRFSFAMCIPKESWVIKAVEKKCKKNLFGRKVFWGQFEKKMKKKIEKKNSKKKCKKKFFLVKKFLVNF